MPLRSHRVLPLVGVCLALSVAQTFAAKPEPTRVSLSGPSTEHRSGSVTGTATSCPMGIQGPAAFGYGYVLPPDDQYYTLLNPASCPTCPDPVRLIQTAHMELFFLEPCEIPVSVSIMPAFDNGAGCYQPNPFAPATCPPVQYVVSDGGQLQTCVDHALPVAAACCVNGPVFLVFEFDQGSCANARPYFCGPAACAACTQYNFYPGAQFPGDDLCTELAPFNLFGNIMWAESECCAPTSTLPGSWGSLKTLYR